MTMTKTKTATKKSTKPADPMKVGTRVVGAWHDERVGTVVARYAVTYRKADRQVANVKRGNLVAIGVPLDTLRPTNMPAPQRPPVQSLHDQLMASLGVTV
jgi:hypothetical protein